MILAQRGDNSLFPKSKIFCVPECKLNAFLKRLLFFDVAV